MKFTPEKIKTFMTATGHTVDTLARALSASTTTIEGWLSGETYPRGLMSSRLRRLMCGEQPIVGPKEATPSSKHVVFTEQKPVMSLRLTNEPEPGLDEVIYAAQLEGAEIGAAANAAFVAELIEQGFVFHRDDPEEEDDDNQSE